MGNPFLSREINYYILLDFFLYSFAVHSHTHFCEYHLRWVIIRSVAFTIHTGIYCWAYVFVPTRQIGKIIIFDERTPPFWALFPSKTVKETINEIIYRIWKWYTPLNQIVCGRTYTTQFSVPFKIVDYWAERIQNAREIPFQNSRFGNCEWSYEIMILGQKKNCVSRRFRVCARAIRTRIQIKMSKWLNTPAAHRHGRTKSSDINLTQADYYFISFVSVSLLCPFYLRAHYPGGVI